MTIQDKELCFVPVAEGATNVRLSDMEERIDQLKTLLNNLRSDCYTDMYHICDTPADVHLNTMSDEAQFYLKLLNDIDAFTSQQPQQQ